MTTRHAHNCSVALTHINTHVCGTVQAHTAYTALCILISNIICQNEASVDATLCEDPSWLLAVLRHLFCLVLNSLAFLTCLWAFMVLALGLCESCCLEIVCSRRHFQLSSRGKEKQFHAWATVNPSLSVPLLDALKSHPAPSRPLYPSAPVIGEWESISLEVKWGCALHAPLAYHPPWCHSLLFPGTCNFPPCHETSYFTQWWSKPTVII